MVALTMMALALSEDSIRLRKKRNAIIDELGRLPDHIREVGTKMHKLCSRVTQLKDLCGSAWPYISVLSFRVLLFLSSQRDW